MSEDLPDVFTSSSSSIHKKKVEVSTDDVSPVPPADDSLLIDQAIMDEEPGTSPVEKKDNGPTSEVPEGNVAAGSEQPESKEPRPSNDQSSRPHRRHCPLVRLAYDSFSRWADHRIRCHIYALFKQINLYSQVLSCNNHPLMDIYT